MPGAAAPSGVVFDTNVLLDFWIFDDARTRPLRRALESGAVRAWRSAACDAELADVLARAQFNLTPAQAGDLLAAWQRLARDCAAVYAAPWSCSDPHDQKFLDLAYSARAALLVTKDKALLKIAGRLRRRGAQLAILPPDNAARALALPPA
jgi:putative PIN family toxin of toxin-antitoxin system